MFTNSIKNLAAIFAVVVSFIAGYRFAAALYGADISELRGDYATRAAALEEKYREEERGKAAALAAAWEERDKARGDAVDLRADLERVRGEYDAFKRRVSRADANPAKPNREPSGGGAELVARCSEVVARCVGLAQELSADRDAVSSLINYPRRDSQPTPAVASDAYPKDRLADRP